MLFLGALWAFALESFLFIRTDHVARIPNLPKECEGIQIAVASDWHVGSEHVSPARGKRLATKIGQARPDLILLPGDFVAHGIYMTTLTPAELSPALSPLAKAAPTYAVLGNHDHVDLQPSMVIEPFKKVGIQALFNENRLVSLRGGRCKLRLVGVADDFIGASAHQVALAGLPKGEVRIGLTHSPTLYPKIQKDVDILFAGHTHGGVACVPFTSLCISRMSKWGSQWVKGVYQPEGFHAPLLITNGIGNSVIPLRFAAPPGFDMVRLERGEGEQPHIAVRP